MALVVELQANGDYQWGQTYDYPDEYKTSHHVNGVWVYVNDASGNTVGMHRADLVASVYRTAPAKSVPIDTRMNHTLLARDAKGRFVSKKKS